MGADGSCRYHTCRQRVCRQHFCRQRSPHAALHQHRHKRKPHNGRRSPREDLQPRTAGCRRHAQRLSARAYQWCGQDVRCADGCRADRCARDERCATVCIEQHCGQQHARLAAWRREQHGRKRGARPAGVAAAQPLHGRDARFADRLLQLCRLAARRAARRHKHCRDPSARCADGACQLYRRHGRTKDRSCQHQPLYTHRHPCLRRQHVEAQRCRALLQPLDLQHARRGNPLYGLGQEVFGCPVLPPRTVCVAHAPLDAWRRPRLQSYRDLCRALVRPSAPSLFATGASQHRVAFLQVGGRVRLCGLRKHAPLWLWPPL